LEVPSSSEVVLFVISVPVKAKPEPILKVAFSAFIVPEEVPPCWNSIFPPVPEETLASSVAPVEISALPLKIRSPP